MSQTNQNPKTLTEIPINDISPNPLNPRLIFDAQDLDDLKKSIDKVGILVPLTVYRNSKSFPKTPYILLDGERRWRCAQELNHTLVLANVIDEPSDDTQNILYMFNIHHFRKEWALFPTALKLEIVIQKLGTDQESVLSNFTGVSRSMIRRCKTLLWYPHKYRDLLMLKGGKISTDFFIELYPIAYRLSSEKEYYYPGGTEVFVDKMIEKFLVHKVIYDVKEFREIRRTMGFFDKIDFFISFLDMLTLFFKDDKAGLEVFTAPEIDEDRGRNTILKYVSYLNTSLRDVNSDLISDYTFVEQIKQLNKTLQDLLENIE